jgi:hypothetical protein
MGQKWYHSNRKNKLSLQVSFNHFKWTPIQEEDKTITAPSEHLIPHQHVGFIKLYSVRQIYFAFYNRRAYANHKMSKVTCRCASLPKLRLRPWPTP